MGGKRTKTASASFALFTKGTSSSTNDIILISFLTRFGKVVLVPFVKLQASFIHGVTAANLLEPIIRHLPAKKIHSRMENETRIESLAKLLES